MENQENNVIDIRTKQPLSERPDQAYTDRIKKVEALLLLPAHERTQTNEAYLEAARSLASLINEDPSRGWEDEKRQFLDAWGSFAHGDFGANFPVYQELFDGGSALPERFLRVLENTVYSALEHEVGKTTNLASLEETVADLRTQHPSSHFLAECISIIEDRKAEIAS